MALTTKQELENLHKMCCKKYLNLDKSIDWEQRRYEIAKAILPSIYSSFKGSPKWECETAVMLADELINQLKKTSK